MLVTVPPRVEISTTGIFPLGSQKSQIALQVIRYEVLEENSYILEWLYLWFWCLKIPGVLRVLSTVHQLQWNLYSTLGTLVSTHNTPSDWVEDSSNKVHLKPGRRREKQPDKKVANLWWGVYVTMKKLHLHTRKKKRKYSPWSRDNTWSMYNKGQGNWIRARNP